MQDVDVAQLEEDAAQAVVVFGAKMDTRSPASDAKRDAVALELAMLLTDTGNDQEFERLV